ncbi:hypothetical protein DRN82_08515 [Thermococci archaeon]|nr:MAG: hypothetical protein DRN82_08515 [Thermococci archaeon]
MGGGVAGLEFARVAKLRGHEVTILEKSDKLGGLLWLAGARLRSSELKLSLTQRQHQNLSRSTLRM